MSTNNQLGCLGTLLGMFGYRGPSEAPAKQGFPYGLRDEFLSPAEVSFYHVLKGILGEDRMLITKVRLGDLFFVRQPHRNQSARNQIDRKHVDFVICDARTMQPLLGIELDDASHQRKDRQDRDAFVDHAFDAAGLPLLHIPAARGYQPNELAEAIERKLAPTSPHPFP